MLIKMSAEITRELERLSLEIDEIKKLSHSGLKTLSPEIKLKKYHALLNRISKCAEVDITPDELISSLRRKDY